MSNSAVMTTSQIEDPGKSSEVRIIKRKAHSSMKVLSRVQQVNLPKEFDRDLLIKIKPKAIRADKEELYQENLHLKLKNHSLSEEITKIKTRCSQIEQELFKKDKSKDSFAWDKSQSNNLNSNLRLAVKELKGFLDLKDKEIFKLKSSLKCSRANELEAELQAYIDECTRLRHHLEELMKSKNESSEQELLTAQTLEILESEKKELESSNQLLQNEVKELQLAVEEEKKKKKLVVRKSDVNQRAEIQKLKAALNARDKEVKDKDKEIKNRDKETKEKEEKFKADIAVIKGKLDSALQKLKLGPSNLLAFKPAAPVFFKIVYLCQKTRGFKELLEAVKPLKTVTQIFDYFKTLYPQFRQNYVIEILDLFRIKKPEQVYELIKEWYYIYDYSTEHPELELEGSKQHQKALNEERKSPSKFVTTKPEPVFIKVNQTKPEKSAKSSPERTQNLASPPKQSTDEYEDSFEEEEQKEIPVSAVSKETTPHRESSSSLVPKLLINFDQTKDPEQKAKSSINLSKMWQKISLSLQINRFPSQELLNYLPQSLDSKTFSGILASEPFNFSEEDSKHYSECLFSSISPTQKAKGLAEYLYGMFKVSTKEWEIFNQDQEDEFNSELVEIVEKNKADLMNLCRQADLKQTGNTSIQEFKDVVSKLGITFTEKMWNYLQLLFYSCNEELDQVPYVYFLDNFGKADDEEIQEVEETDQHIASIVRRYIEKIADKIISKNLTVKTAFKHTAGYIYPEQFVGGLEKLGIVNVPEQDLELILQALQDEDSEDTCIFIEELQDILNNYGVGEDEEGLVKGSVDKGESLIKLESKDEAYVDEYEEYSEDT